MAIGGVQSGGDLQFTQSRTDVASRTQTVGFRARNNDIGAILAGATLYGAASVNGSATSVGVDEVLDNPIIFDKGNIRSVSAANVSRLVNGSYGLIPNITAGKSIGRIESAGYLYFNANGLNVANGQPSANLTIGGDYQVISAGADFSANLSANGGIGVIRAGSVSQGIAGFPGYFGIDADGLGRDGYIGLIDVVGNFGTFQYGGPAISSGQGTSSNVRYMRVGGDVYRDFGAGAGQSNVIETTTTTTIVDDSGAIVTLTPIIGEAFDTTPDTTNGGNGNDTTTGGDVDDDVIGGIPNNPIGSNPDIGSPIGTPDTTGGSDQPDTRPRTATGRLIGGQLIISTYPTRNGGSVIFRVEALDPAPVDTLSVGVEINTTGTGQAEIGEIITNSFGSASVDDPTDLDDDTQPTKQDALELADVGVNKEVIITGRRTSVFDIHGADALADYTQIFNGTDGEIVNITAGDIVSLEAQWIGVSRPAGSVQLDGLVNASATANVYPFNQTKNAVNINNALEIRARGPIGNVIANDIQLLEANADNKNTKGDFEGIVAPILATDSIRRVDIGEGLQTAGTGETSTGGLYAGRQIGLISNDNGEGDLRGDVIFGDYLEGIRLRGNASMIDADIFQNGNGTSNTGAVGYTVGFETNSFLINANTTTGLDGVGDIRIQGTGGIMNSRVLAQNMGTTTVSDNGFGVLNSTFYASGGGTMKGLIAGGLGIRNSAYTGGAFVGDVVATGGGKLLDLDKYTTSVRGSLNGFYDYQSGQSFNAANDLYLFFGTSSDDSTIEGVTNAGIIADTTIVASRSIESVRAFDFRSFNLTNLSPSNELYPSTINFANTIGTIASKRNINGLRLVGGTIGTLSVGGSMSNFVLQGRSNVGEIVVKKNVLGTSRFNVTDGAINSFRVGGNMNGTIFANNGIASLIVDGDVRSARDQGGIYTTRDIGTLKIGGDVLGGAYIRARKTIKSLTLNGDFDSGAIIRAAKFGKTTIRGDREGTLQRS